MSLITFYRCCLYKLCRIVKSYNLPYIDPVRPNTTPSQETLYRIDDLPLYDDLFRGSNPSISDSILEGAPPPTYCNVLDSKARTERCSTVPENDFSHVLQRKKFKKEENQK